jgi:hypothetical protein
MLTFLQIDFSNNGLKKNYNEKWSTHPFQGVDVNGAGDDDHGQVEEEADGREHEQDRPGAGHGADRGPMQRVAHGHETLDGERHHEPHTEKTAHRRQVHDGLAEALLVVEAHVHQVEPHAEHAQQVDGVADGERRQVVARAELTQLGRAEHHHRQAVAQRAQQHQGRRVVELDGGDDGHLGVVHLLQGAVGGRRVIETRVHRCCL